MSIVTDHLAAVNQLPIILSLEAVNEGAGNASWLHQKPIEEAVAVKFGEACWLSSRPETEVPSNQESTPWSGKLHQLNANASRETEPT